MGDTPEEEKEDEEDDVDIEGILADGGFKQQPQLWRGTGYEARLAAAPQVEDSAVLAAHLNKSIVSSRASIHTDDEKEGARLFANAVAELASAAHALAEEFSSHAKPSGEGKQAEVIDRAMHAPSGEDSTDRRRSQEGTSVHMFEEPTVGTGMGQAGTDSAASGEAAQKAEVIDRAMQSPSGEDSADRRRSQEGASVHMFEEPTVGTGMSQAEMDRAARGEAAQKAEVIDTAMHSPSGEDSADRWPNQEGAPVHMSEEPTAGTGMGQADRAARGEAAQKASTIELLQSATEQPRRKNKILEHPQSSAAALVFLCLVSVGLFLWPMTSTGIVQSAECKY